MVKDSSCCVRFCVDCTWIRFSSVIYLDLTLLVMHVLAAFILYNGAMIFPVIVIRLPRFLFRALDTLCQKDKQEAGVV